MSITNVRSNSVITRLTGCVSTFVLMIIQPQFCVTLDPKRCCLFFNKRRRRRNKARKAGRKEGGGVEMLSWV